MCKHVYHHISRTFVPKPQVGCVCVGGVGGGEGGEVYCNQAYHSSMMFIPNPPVGCVCVCVCVFWGGCKHTYCTSKIFVSNPPVGL